MALPAPPPTRQISWEQTVREADPSYQRELIKPVIYTFSNGREFVKDPDVYTN